MLKAWFWTSGRFFATPFFCGALLIGVVLAGGSLSNLNTWLAFFAALFCMASGHMVNTWGDWKTGLDKPSERSVEKAYTAGCGLIAEGKMTEREALINSLMWLGLSAIFISILAARVGAIILVPWILGWGTGWWYTFIGKYNWTHETALASGVVAASIIGALSTGTGLWVKALLVSIPICLIFSYAGLALDEYPDAPQNLAKGVKSLAYKVYEMGYDLSTYIMLWVFAAFLVQLFFISVGILKPLTALTLLILPPAIGASIFLCAGRSAFVHSSFIELASKTKNDALFETYRIARDREFKVFRKAALVIVVIAMFYPVLLLLGQALG